MGGEQHGMVASEGTYQISYLDYLTRVKSHRRLVEYDDLRVSDKCRSNADALPITLGEARYQTVADIRDLNDLAYLGKVLLSVIGAVTQLVDKAEIFEHRHIGVERRNLGQISY